ncbi:monovalent cation/H+ antiporter complex subunit F [Pusillimonas sp. SM2304]|uniref:monovalent cation/H+ antiporter complex subunit F n=1 Tax=Pusillimonas sp. SM2304 TaxID=3073241 RepID=UPI002875B53E|nr:monovalent cation/H+ antiporter complex subunit F [Pusillimonas sp. SM2304]MDS1139449.1 monovalent cation/H+ antiporter complex subunit F [Pusillimonas sp. SM2304]
MIDTVFSVAIEISKFLLFLSMILVCIRIVRGPHAGDRVVALDMLCLLGVGIAALAAIASGSMAFIDVVLGIALIGFLATVAFAGFIARGAAQDRED